MLVIVKQPRALGELSKVIPIGIQVADVSSNTLPGMPHPPEPEQNLVEYCNADPAHRKKLRFGTEAAAQIAPTRHTSQTRHSNRLLQSFPVLYFIRSASKLSDLLF